MATASTSANPQTLAQLRKRVAQRFGDYVLLTCTSNGTTTSLIDVYNISTATEDMKGRTLLFSSGEVRPVLTQTDSTGTLTFAAISSATVVEAADTVEVFNKRGKGFKPVEYRDAINAAINDAFPLGMIEVTDSNSAFDAATGSTTVDVSLHYVHTVEWQDDDSFWHVIPKATRTSEYGWIADGMSGVIRILGAPAWAADGQTIRTVGFGRQDILTADSDSCLLNAEYIVERAVAHLAMSAIDRDRDFYGVIANAAIPEAKRLRTRVRTTNRGELVRSV